MLPVSYLNALFRQNIAGHIRTIECWSDVLRYHQTDGYLVISHYKIHSPMKICLPKWSAEI